MIFNKVLVAIALMQLSTAVFSAAAQDVVATNLPSVVLQSSLGVKVCSTPSNHQECEEGEMPKGMGAVHKVLPGNYVPSAKASWIAIGSKWASVCSMGTESTMVDCIRIVVPQNISKYEIGSLGDMLLFSRRGEVSDSEKREEYRFAVKFNYAVNAAATSLQRDHTKKNAPLTAGKRFGARTAPILTEPCSYEAWIKWMCDDRPIDPPDPEPAPTPLPDPYPTPEYPIIPVPGDREYGDGGCVYGPITICRTQPPTGPWDVPKIPTSPGDSPGTTTPPPPSPEEECRNLNNKVQDAKYVVGQFKPAACQPGMSQWDLLQRKNAWLDEASARAHRDGKCWNGGDEGHQKAQASAWQHAGNCGQIANP